MASAKLYAASARRVLRAQGLSDLGSRLRRHDERLVFVFGSPRSGTTFLAGTIGGLPGFVDLSEVNPYKAVIPALSGVSDPEAAARIRAVLERVRRLALVPGLRGVEQTPETAFVLPAALRAYPQARGVHVLRDGRDVVCSLLERGWLSTGRRGGDDARLAYGSRARFWVEPERVLEFEKASDATRAAWAWRRYASTASAAADERTLEVRYDSIAADPVAAARAIATHLAVDPGPLERNLERFHDRSIGRYRRDLSSEQLADVEREAGTLLHELGFT
ncbi:MAG TPA: sulfotransferase [Gaiellaceae bacterium]|nr:sulfotransferase [Gaiellaceae bacterium]